MTAPIANIIQALEARDCRPRSTSETTFMAKCPAHPDRNPSLSIKAGDDSRVLLKCHAGCEAADIVAALGLTMPDLFDKDESSGVGISLLPLDRAGQSPEGHLTAPLTDLVPLDRPDEIAGVPSSTPADEIAGCTLAQVAELKHLEIDFLASLGLSEQKYAGRRAVRIPYTDESGKQTATRYRIGLHADADRFRWKSGSKLGLYGLSRIAEARARGGVLLVEGESDCWTAWYHGIPALGVPGKSTWKPEWAKHLEGLRVYIWQEPDAEGFTESILRDIPDARVIVAPDFAKDISAAHIAGICVPTLLDELKSKAVAGADIVKTRADAESDRHESDAAAVLEHEDPLALYAESIRSSGYGGDFALLIILLVAATGRVLEMRLGQMPVHTFVLGLPSSGKSFAVKIVLRLLPEGAVVIIDAGSPRALIYADAELEYRLLVFGEADSLPTGEDGAAMSAIRNLLQDGRLHYEVVEKDDTGSFAVRHIDKPGPTTLFTTGVKRLEQQMMSRFFTLEVPDTLAQTRAALAASGDAELYGTKAPDAALIAFQAYLQSKAPWRVQVPFARVLADCIAKRPSATRVLRDYARLLSLIKSVAVIRHRHRETDDHGRVVATLDDYAAVHLLIAEMFESSVTGVSETTRETVEAVEKLKAAGKQTLPLKDLADDLGLSKQATSYRVSKAIKGGWLINHQDHPGRTADIDLGEVLPDTSGLPSPDELGQAVKTWSNTRSSAEQAPDLRGQAVKPETGGDATP
jgi:hypothetical protein